MSVPVGSIINSVFVGLDAVDNVKNGDNVVKAVGKAGIEMAVTDFAFGLLSGPAAIAVMGAQIGGAVLDFKKELDQMDYDNVNNVLSHSNGNIGGNVINSQQACTMRQRGIQALQYGEQNTRSILGSEARSYVHSL